MSPVGKGICSEQREMSCQVPEIRESSMPLSCPVLPSMNLVLVVWETSSSLKLRFCLGQSTLGLAAGTFQTVSVMT